MPDFKSVSIEDGQWLRPLLLCAPDRGCEYSFGNIFIWSHVSDIDVARFSDGALIRFEKNPCCYLWPVGCSDIRAALEFIIEDSDRLCGGFRIIAARREDIETAERLFPNTFKYHETRDYAEYVYNSADLRELAGKRYHGKRGHIARFEREHTYEFKEITPDSLPRLLEFNESWFASRTDADESLKNEHIAACAALNNFEQLGMSGGYIETEQGIVAYSIGEPLNDEVFCVHIEKALSDVTGAYTIINREFARRFCSDYKYINREDDAGEEGLRRAKLSYYPEYTTEKFVITRSAK